MRTSAYVYLSVLLLWSANMARAEDDADALTLMRVLCAEGGRTPSADHVAIMHVLQSRADRVRREPVYIARLYSVSHNGRATNVERAARMRSLRLDEIPNHIARLVMRWMRGDRPRNPCPGAIHFAAPSVASPLPRVTCTAPTRNLYYSARVR